MNSRRFFRSFNFTPFVRYFGSRSKFVGRAHTRRNNDFQRLVRGRVVGGYGQRFLVEDVGRIIRDGYSSRLRHRHAATCKGIQSIYCGDYVMFQRPIYEDEGDAIIHKVLPRKNAFQRSDKNQRGGLQTLATNIDRCILVLPCHPATNSFFIDRVLAQARRMRAGLAIVLNKIDLIETLTPKQQLHLGQVQAALNDFQRIGYPIFRTSATNGDGVPELTEFLAGYGEASDKADMISSAFLAEPNTDDWHAWCEASRWRNKAYNYPTNVFIGPSGAGKSSLLNAIFPELEIVTNEVIRKTGQGKHTTSATTMHILPPQNISMTNLIQEEQDQQEAEKEETKQTEQDRSMEDITAEKSSNNQIDLDTEIDDAIDESDADSMIFASNGDDTEEEVEKKEKKVDEKVISEMTLQADVIDSPGFNQFVPVPIKRVPNVIKGMVEFLGPAMHCQYTNCMHTPSEQGCGVLDAVAEGFISQRRYDSYLRMCDTMNKLRENVKHARKDKGPKFKSYSKRRQERSS